MKEMASKEEQIDSRTWWQRNKKKVIGVAATVVILGGSILLFKNWDEVSARAGSLFKPKKPCTALPKTSVTPAIDNPPVVIKPNVVTRVIAKDGKEQLVHMHLRNLHEGRGPSAEKRALAEELDIDLEEGQTWVIEYTKNRVA